MNESTLEPLNAHIPRIIGPRAVLGESPIWDSRNSALAWVDIDGRTLFRWQSTTDSVSEFPMPGRPGSVMLSGDADILIVALEHSITTIDMRTGELSPIVELAIPEATTRLNDGKCDRSGRLWVGSMHAPASEGKSTGSLFCVATPHKVSEVFTGVGVANGIAFSPDGAVMYFADSARGMVWSYTMDQESGVLSNEQVFVDFKEAGLPGRPDGACVDEDGCYWIACVYGSAIARITPRGGVDRIIAVPAQRPTCCAFGGDDLSTLFVTSIGGGGAYPVFENEPDAGRIFAFDLGVRGLNESRWCWW